LSFGEHQVEVVAPQVLRPDAGLAAPAVAAALHEAHDVPKEEGMPPSALNLLEVLAEELPVAMWIVQVDV